MSKTVSILGVTGSVGQSAADVILSAPERFDVQTVSAHTDVETLADRAVRLHARKAVIADEGRLEALKTLLDGTGIEAFGGEAALVDLAGEEADVTLAAIVGMAGLKPIMAALCGSRAVAIANKEPLVAAGPLVLAQAEKYGTQILPVDSEHNAIFQVFEEQNRAQIERIILTASGGPFRTWSLAQMAEATVEQALAHPNWSMGAKISVDSATMMNKALEVIEAHYLFGLPPERIDVLVHPQSVVHSMVEYTDGSILAQMGASDMRTPVSYALAWPDRMRTPGERLDFAAVSRLDFDAPDFERFPALSRAYDVLAAGPGACVAFNAANEVAVAAFLKQKTGFSAIMDVVDYVLESADVCSFHDAESLFDLDRGCRAVALDYIQSGLMKKAM